MHPTDPAPAARDSGSRRTAPPVQVLLSTFDGERHLPELLSSLEAQTHRAVEILARDDGSADGTPALLDRAARAGRLRIPEPGRTPGAQAPLGPARSFGALLEASDADYVMPCDQDDRWHVDKIAVTLEAMRSAEAEAGSGTPLLVHTDLEVADAELNVVAPSFWAYHGLRPELAGRFERALVQNAVTGCTVMVNRALLDRALPVPPEAAMHDWWLALVAAAFGRVVAVSRSTVRYRRHPATRTRPGGVGARELGGKAIRLFDRRETRDSVREAARQARAFRERYDDRLDASHLRALEALAGLDERPFLERRWTLLRHGLLRHGLARNLGLFVRV